MDPLEDHPLSEIFPLLGEPELAELAESIARNGQREVIVLHQGRILDGRNRYRACVKAGVKPRTRIFEPAKDGTPLKYVMDTNVHRRHLTASQRAAAAATFLKVQEEEAQKALDQLQEDEANDDPKTPDPAFSERKQGKKPEGQATQKAAAAAMDVSPSTVRDAQNLQENAPDEFEAVQKGEKTINQAKEDAAAEKRKEERKQILKDLEKVCGPKFAQAVANNVILKTAKELAAFVALSDEDKRLVQAHVSTGWKVTRALTFAKDAIDSQSTVGDLINKCISAGGEFVTTVGAYEISAYKVQED